MHKKTFLILVVILGLFLFVGSALSQETQSEDSPAEADSPTGASAFKDKLFGLEISAPKAGYTTGDEGSVIPTLNRVANVGLGAAAVLFFAMALYAGIRWMTARGNEELVTRAQGALEAAVLGIIIVAASYAISVFVIGKLYSGGGNGGNGGAEMTGVCCVGVGTGTGASAMTYCSYHGDPEYKCTAGNTVPVSCTEGNCCQSISGCAY